MTLKPALLAAALAAAFSGCAQIPLVAKEATMTHAAAEKVAHDGWQMHEAVVNDGSQAFVLHMPVTAPKSVKNKPFSIEMSRPMTVTDVAQVLSRAGIPVVIDDIQGGGAGAVVAQPATGTAPAGARTSGGATGKTVFIPRYTGTVGSFLAAVSKSTDTWFTWQDGFLRASAMEEVAVSLPQDPELIKAIKTSLDELEAENVTLSLEAGLLVFRVAPSGIPKVRAYLDRAIANAALVTLQVAMVSVTSDQDSAQGLDWSSLQLAFGGGIGAASNILSALGGDASSTTTSTDPGQGGYLSGSKLRVAGSLGNFSLMGFVDFMNSYGDARTVQNAMVTTLSANEVELTSVTDVPYVSSVSVGSTGSSSGGGLIGSSQTATAKDGLTLKLKPYYDRASNMVTLPLDVKVQAVLGFKDLSAGNQVGSLTQPTTGTRSLKDTLRMRPGETMVIGGITFDSVSRSDGLPLFMNAVAGKGLEHKTLKVSRNSLYIIIRPTVRLTPPILEQEGFSLVREAAPLEVPEPVATQKPAAPKRAALFKRATSAKAAPAVKREGKSPAPAAEAPAPTPAVPAAETKLDGLSPENRSELADLGDLSAESLAELNALPEASPVARILPAAPLVVVSLPAAEAPAPTASAAAPTGFAEVSTGFEEVRNGD